MKPIEKEELYEHLCQFLKTRGVEMKDGTYPKAIQTGCSFLADAINLSQKGIAQAKGQIDKNLDRMRQVIHEKTAPKPPPKAHGSPKPKAQTPKSKARRAKRKTAKSAAVS